MNVRLRSAMTTIAMEAACKLLVGLRMPSLSSTKRVRALLTMVLCGPLVTLCGCRTTYEATSPRIVRVGDVDVSIDHLRDRRVAEVRAVDVGAARAGVPPLRDGRLGTQQGTPCATGPRLWEPGEAPHLRSDHFLVDLPLGGRALYRPGVTLDLTFDDQADSCVQLPLTSEGGEILWHGSAGWIGGGHVSIDWPTGSVGDVGPALTAEVRFHKPVRFAGRWRLALGAPFGVAGCRGHCPSLAWDNDRGLTGVFYHAGATASIARAISIGDWLILPTVGIRSSLYYLDAASDWEGERFGILAGPFAALGVLRASAAPAPGFDPPRVPYHGIEVTLSALRPFGRTPEGIAWIIGVGWAFDED